jgi:hypothetical protein
LVSRVYLFILGDELRTKRPDLFFLGIFILVVLLAGGLTWVNYQIVLNDQAVGGYAPLWMGTRMAILDRQNPYSVDTSEATQSLMYGGRLAYSGEDPGWFLYPFFSILIFAPTALIPDYDIARAVWMTLLGGSLFAIAFASLELTRWHPSGVVLMGYLLFFLAGYYAVRSVYFGNPSVLVTLFIILAFLLIQRRRDLAAGIILGLSTFKPQMMFLLWCFVLLWGVSRRRLALVVGLIFTPIGLAIVASIIQPGWLTDNLTLMTRYAVQFAPLNFGGIFKMWWDGAGEILGWFLTLGLSVLLVIEWWQALGKDLRWFLWTAGLTLVITNMIGFPTATSNYVVLIPVLTLVISILDQRSVGFGRYFVILVMLIVLGGVWWLYFETERPGLGLQQAPIMFIPLPVLVFIMLYWIKYWALNSVRLPVEKLETLKNL